MPPSVPSKSTVPSSGQTTSKAARPSSLPAPILPTSLETLLLSLYPATLLLGSLFSLIDPSARRAPYNALTQSHPPDRAPSYFALKRNLVNLYFVKINWLWISLAFLTFLFFHRINGPPGPVLTPRKLRGALRYLAATAWWFLVTQWFFGPALIDRGFRITGGACELAGRFEGTGGKTELVTARTCKAVGGVWKGGHDISGHVFILVLGSAFLGMELLPVLIGSKGLADARVVKRRDGERSQVAGEATDSWSDEPEGMMGQVATWAPVIVAGLNWWMLLMTAAYFHTWFEKVSLATKVLRHEALY